MNALEMIHPSFLFGGVASFLWVLGTLFWIWMLYDCIRNEPDRSIWIIILMMLNFPGALIYFFVRRLPQMNIPIPRFLRRWTHAREIDRNESAVRNIGGAYQYIELGNVYFEVGQLEQAKDSFEKALLKKPDDLQALWGIISVELEQKQYDSAKLKLEKLLSIDPKYKYGEPSLAYASVLFEQQNFLAAKGHLLDHIKKWTHPKGLVMLARILLQEGNTSEARQCLESVITDIKATPGFYRRNNMRWARQASRLLRQIK